jgi:transposase
MFEYRQVLVRMRLGDSNRQIAKAKLMGRRKAKTLRQLAEAQGWLDPARPLPDDQALAEALRPAVPVPTAAVCSSVEPFRAQVEAWHAAGVQGTTIHQALVRNHGFTGSYSAVRRFLQGIRSRAPAATVILSFAPGEAAQVDFGAGPRLMDPRTGELRKSWVFVMTLCHSRHQYAELIWHQDVATWLACHRRAFEWFGGVPARVIIDNAKCAITRACTRDPEVQRAYAECAEGYGFKIEPCPPREPQKKGRVEAGVKYLKRSFLPLREFADIDRANAELHQWLLETAGNRIHGSTRERPLARFAQTEKGLLRPLPDVPPVLATWAQVKVHRDAHVQYQKCLYSVPFRWVGQRLWLKATDTTVQLYRDHELIASHPRLHRPGQRATVNDHLPPEAIAYQLRDPQWCLQAAEAVGPRCRALVEHLFADRVLENLRAAQGVLGLKKTYGADRLEAACDRALTYDNPRYRTVKTILQKGLDQHAQDAHAFDALSETYTGGARFGRNTRTLLN